MINRNSWLRLLPVLLLLVGLLLQPAPLEAQCSVATTQIMTLGTIMVVYKILNGPYNCGTTMMNALFCNPTAMTGTSFLHASAMAATMNPSCAWTCTGTGGGTCATVTIDVNDGLPVELMEFSVEDEGVSDGTESRAGEADTEPSRDPDA
jgi:hypothetical protein